MAGRDKWHAQRFRTQEAIEVRFIAMPMDQAHVIGSNGSSDRVHRLEIKPSSARDDLRAVHSTAANQMKDVHRGSDQANLFGACVAGKLRTQQLIRPGLPSSSG